MTWPVVTRVSQATRARGSWVRMASRTASLIWSATLSGWPMVTDWLVNRCVLRRNCGGMGDRSLLLVTGSVRVKSGESTAAGEIEQAAKNWPLVEPILYCNAMRYLLNLLITIAWALWLGGTIATFVFGLNLFHKYPDAQYPGLAGQANSAMFLVFGWYELVL